MSRLGINTGSSPNDGQGDPLRIAMGKINSNFTEIYNTIGDGNTLTSYASTAGISTLAQNLTGSPRINVSGILNTGITTTEHLEVRNIISTGVVTATQFVGDGSQLTNVTALVGGLEVLDDNVRKGVARELNFGANIVSTGPDGVGRVTISVSTTTQAPSAEYANIAGVSTYSLISGISTNAIYANIAGVATYSTLSGVSTYASTAGISTLAQGLTGTPNLNVGVVTATSYSGSGINLIGIITTLVAGTNVTITQTSGIATISAAGTGGGGSGDYAVIAGYSTSSGIATVAQGLTGTPNINVNQIGISSYLSVSGVTSFYNNVHIEYDKELLIGNNNELQLYHNATNSYIDNSSGGNLIIRAHGGSIQLQKETPELMGVFNTDGSVELYHNNSKKFETTGYGVTIFGGLNSTGVITATRFESTSAGTPTIDSPNNLNINAITVAISTNVTVGGNLYAGINTSTGLILTSPNGSKYRLVVDNSGNLSTVLVP